MEIDDAYEMARNMARFLTTEQLDGALEELEDGDGPWLFFVGYLDVGIDNEIAMKATRDELEERLSREETHTHVGYDS
jgi:hypothetical protein